MSSPATECIALLQSKNIQVCVFDMDLTAVAAHSRGRLRLGQRMDEYLAKATPAFCALVPLLHEAGIGLAIATHSDEAEYDGINVKREIHILGTELARALIQRHFSEEIAEAFFIVAFNPRIRKVTDERDLIKRYHMRTIKQHFSVQNPEQIVFFDDLERTVKDCADFCKVRAIQVDETVGFQFKDLLDNL